MVRDIRYSIIAYAELAAVMLLISYIVRGAKLVAV
jgi:hypothetical protein